MLKPQHSQNGGVDRQALELQFGQAANDLYESLLDLNVPTSQLGASWQQILATRGKILMSYGVAPSAAEVPGAGGMVKPGMVAGGCGFPPQPGFMGQAPFDWTTYDWKSKLQQACSLRAKKPMTKGGLVYIVDADPNGGGYVSSLSPGQTEFLGQDYASAAPAASKRLAEHAAAKAALEAEFPEAYQAVCASAGWPGGPGAGNKRNMAAMMMGGWADPSMWMGGPAQEASGPKDGKSRLQQAAALLLGRPVLKTDVVYETWKPEGDDIKQSTFQSTVTIPEYDATVYEGQPGEGKKGAECNAAEAALTALEDQVKTLTELRRQKKAEKEKAKREETKAKKEAAEANGGVMPVGEPAAKKLKVAPVPAGMAKPAGALIPKA